MRSDKALIMQSRDIMRQNKNVKLSPLPQDQ